MFETENLKVYWQLRKLHYFPETMNWHHVAFWTWNPDCRGNWDDQVLER